MSNAATRRTVPRWAVIINDADQVVTVHPHTPWGASEATQVTVRELIEAAAAIEHPQHEAWVELEKAALKARGVNLDAEDFDINEQAEVTADEMVARGLVTLQTLWELTDANVRLN